MSEKIKPENEDEVEKVGCQNSLDLLNAWLDYIEIKKGKPISEVVKDCMVKDSNKLE